MYNEAIDRPRVADVATPEAAGPQAPHPAEQPGLLSLHGGWLRRVPAPRDADWLAYLPPIKETAADRSADAACGCAGSGRARGLRLGRFCAAQAEAVNGHWEHTSTCRKCGRRGDDLDCRMGYPSTLYTELHGHLFDPATGTIALAQGSNRLIPYCPALMSGWASTPHPCHFPHVCACRRQRSEARLPVRAPSSQPMNHAFYLVADVTREIRHADVYAAAKWKAEEASAVGCHDLARCLPPRPPPLLDVLAHSLRQSEYATKYNTKVDNINLTTPVATAVEALFPHVRRFETCPLPEDFAKAAKANVSSLTNKVLGLSTFAAAYMAHSILMHDDHVKSHATVVLFADAFKKRGCDVRCPGSCLALGGRRAEN